MFEMLLSSLGKSVPPVITTDFFNIGLPNILPAFNLVTGPDVTFEEEPTIDGVTLAGSLGSLNNSYIEFTSPVNLYTPNWTLEYSVQFVDEAVGSYVSEITFGNAVNNVGVYTRYSTDAFSSRYCIATDNAVNNVYSANLQRNSMKVMKRVAIVKNGNNMTLFINGTLQQVAIGTSLFYNQSNIPTVNTLSSVKYIILGRNASMGACRLKLGPIRFTGKALYTSSYIPVPF